MGGGWGENTKVKACLEVRGQRPEDFGVLFAVEGESPQIRSCKCSLRMEVNALIPLTPGKDDHVSKRLQMSS